MNHHLQQLVSISQKAERRIIGLMSGTSLDGLDIALCRISGHGLKTSVILEHFITIDYPQNVKQEIRKVFAKQEADLRLVCLLHPWIASLHAEYVLRALDQWNISPTAIDIIASHGQTIYHAPQILHGLQQYPNATLQIGDGDHLAVKTGIITLSDFRQKHIAAGGEGAPLALYGDYLLFSNSEENRVMLNMGGIANFTYLPLNGNTADVFVTDTGPGNTLLDAFSQYYFNTDFDRDALQAKQGLVHDELLQELKADAFFALPIPKTTGPELFNKNYVQKAIEHIEEINISPYDVMATLTRFSAETIAEAIHQSVPGNFTIYTSGGGSHNPLLIENIANLLAPSMIKVTDTLGIAGDAKEAVLFAVLANESICGEPVNFNRSGMPAITMGKISFPQ